MMFKKKLMDAILYIQAAKEAHEDMKKQLDADIAIAEANKANFRPPHPSNAAQLRLGRSMSRRFKRKKGPGKI